jgi:hypothetical protein
VAKVMFARLGREIRMNQQTGSFSLFRSFVQLRLTNGPVCFICVVYWEPEAETFYQSFALTNETGDILDDTPTTECVLTSHGENISTAFFYTGFPRAGHYSINVYQNGVCIETIPLEVVEPQESTMSSLAPTPSVGSAAQV